MDIFVLFLLVQNSCMCLPSNYSIFLFRFITDRRIFIVGLGLYGSIHGPSEYDVSLQLIQTTSGTVIGSNHTNFLCDGTNYTFRVMFKNAIEIQPNISYTASATLKVKLLFCFLPILKACDLFLNSAFLSVL